MLLKALNLVSWKWYPILMHCSSQRCRLSKIFSANKSVTLVIERIIFLTQVTCIFLRGKNIAIFLIYYSYRPSPDKFKTVLTKPSSWAAILRGSTYFLQITLAFHRDLESFCSVQFDLFFMSAPPPHILQNKHIKVSMWSVQVKGSDLRKPKSPPPPTKKKKTPLSIRKVVPVRFELSWRTRDKH